VKQGTPDEKNNINRTHSLRLILILPFLLYAHMANEASKRLNTILILLVTYIFGSNSDFSFFPIIGDAAPSFFAKKIWTLETKLNYPKKEAENSGMCRAKREAPMGR